MLEEGSEIFGSFLFLVSTILYAVYRSFGTSILKSPVINTQRLKMSQNAFQLQLSAFVIILAFGVCLVKLNGGDVKGDSQTGVPENWFTAIAGLVIAIFAGLGLIKTGMSVRSRKSLYLIIVVNLIFSWYYRSNLYVATKAANFDGEVRRLAFRFVLIFLVFISAICYWFMSSRYTWRISIILYVSLLIISIALNLLYANILAFFGLSLIIVSFSTVVTPQQVAENESAGLVPIGW